MDAWRGSALNLVTMRWPKEVFSQVPEWGKGGMHGTLLLVLNSPAALDRVAYDAKEGLSKSTTWHYELVTDA